MGERGDRDDTDEDEEAFDEHEDDRRCSCWSRVPFGNAIGEIRPASPLPVDLCGLRVVLRFDVVKL